VEAQQEFVNYLRDGTLLRYATPAEAKLAGSELARIYADFRKHPRMVIDLAFALC
jgi:hypothetical protein